MAKLRQINNLLTYSVIGLAFSACPVLAQGEKLVEIDNETMKFVEVALIVISGFLVTITLFLAIGGVKQMLGKNSGSALMPAAITCIGGATEILIGSLMIGQLTPILGIFLTIFGGIFIAVLIVVIVNSSFVV